MNRILTFVSLVFISNMYNAQGKVGISTETPTESLDVKGTIRVRELPLKDEPNSIYNGDSNKATTFTPTRTIVSDNNGVLGYIDKLPDLDIPNFRKASRCIEGNFGRNNHLVNERSTMTIGNIMVRYNTPNNAAGLSAVIEVKTKNPGSEALVSAFFANAFTDQRFVKANSTQWKHLSHLNYDVEGDVIGTIVVHSDREFYRYTAMGWKQTAGSAPGFCHFMERVGAWNANDVF